MKRLVVLSLVLAMVCGFAGMSVAADDTVRIGVFLPLTGQNAFGGQLELEGVQMAHKESGRGQWARRSNCSSLTTSPTRSSPPTRSSA